MTTESQSHLDPALLERVRSRAGKLIARLRAEHRRWKMPLLT